MVWQFEQVLLVRHGETEWNRAGRRQGQLDSPLTEHGHMTATAVAERIGECRADGMFSSPLGRARVTADVIAGTTGLVPRVEDGLSELHHGDFAGLTNQEIEGMHPGVLAERAGCLFTWRFPGGESYQDADNRAEAVLRRIEVHRSKRPVLVTHEMIGRMLLRRLLNLDPEEALKRSLAQGSVYVIDPAGRTVTER